MSFFLRDSNVLERVAGSSITDSFVFLFFISVVILIFFFFSFVFYRSNWSLRKNFPHSIQNFENDSKVFNASIFFSSEVMLWILWIRKRQMFYPFIYAFYAYIITVKLRCYCISSRLNTQHKIWRKLEKMYDTKRALNPTFIRKIFATIKKDRAVL